MATFNYLGQNSTGAKEKGAITAENSQAAVKSLREKDIVVLEINEQSGSKSGKKDGLHFGSGISEKDMIIFTQQLAIMTKAGLPIVQALRSLVDESGNKSLEKIINSITADVEGGLPLSSAFEKYPKVFSGVYISIIKAGEKSGKVDDVLARLASQLEKDHDIKSKVKGALAYPLFVLSAMVVIVGLIMVFIIPQIQSVFAENGAKLPILTQVIIAISDIIRHKFLYIIAGVALIIYAYRVYYRTEAGKLRIDLIKLNIPIFGSLFRKTSIARFARIFSTLLAAGLPMLEIFKTAQDVVGNEVFRREIAKVAKDVENGMEISAALKKQPHIPRMMVQLTAVGEKSGNIDVIYENLSEFMEKEVDNLTRNLATLLEPALMLVMGVIIGTIVIAILLPIYSLTSSIS